MRASDARKVLPKNPVQKCGTTMSLFLYTLIDPETKDIMKCLMQNNAKFMKAVREMSRGLNEETKQVNGVIRHVYAARSKAKKSKVVLEEPYQLRSTEWCQISKLTGVTYKQIHCLFNQANRKCSKRKITEEQCLTVYKSVLKSTALNADTIQAICPTVLSQGIIMWHIQ